MRTAFATFAVITSASLLSAMPAGRSSSDLESIHTVGARGDGKEVSSSPISPRSPWPDVVTTRPADDGGNATGDQIGDYTFRIPNTKTTITFYVAIGIPVSRTNYRNVVNATINFITEQLAASGDGQLPPLMDPLTYDLEQGMFFRASSWPGQHLTWGLLGVVLRWVNVQLSGYLGYHNPVAFYISDEPWGEIGMGTLTSGYTGIPLPQVVAGDAGVGHWY